MIVKKTYISPSTTSFRIRIDPTSSKAPQELFQEFRQLSKKLLEASQKSEKASSAG